MYEIRRASWSNATVSASCLGIAHHLPDALRRVTEDWESVRQYLRDHLGEMSEERHLWDTWFLISGSNRA